MIFGGNFLIYILLVLLPSLALTGWAAFRVRSTYAKWAKVDSGISMDPFDFARRLLDRQGLNRRPHRADAGPAHRPLRPARQGAAGLAGGGRTGPARLVRPAPWRAVAVPAQSAPRLSVASAAVIAHEVGHALQDRERDPWMMVRMAIVPAVQFGSGVAPWLIIAGLWMNLMGLAWVGLVAFGAAVIFTFVTLPVEIGASGKALAFVSSLGMVGERETGARDVLKAAAWTYVAAALTALLTFLYYLMLIMGRRD